MFCSSYVVLLPAVINLARLSERKELPLFQHFRITKSSFKFLNAWGKMISVQRHYWVKMCLLLVRKGTFIKVNQLR